MFIRIFNGPAGTQGEGQDTPTSFRESIIMFYIIFI
nr:MAG TPA: hypothetical protein [Herelleviridae sp.]